MGGPVTAVARGKFHIFDSAIGLIGLVWTEKGVARVFLPEASKAELIARLQCAVEHLDPSDPSPWVLEAVSAIQDHLHGKLRDLRFVPLDLSKASKFSQRVYGLTAEILPGTLRSYGEIARGLDNPGAVRAVGSALGQNPVPLLIPCHRVVASGGKLGGFSAYGGVATKKALLSIEGAAID